jgi:PAS domain S-box-containing protein
MNDKKKTKEQLIRELEGLRRRVTELDNAKESEEKFAKIFRTSPDPVAISLNSDGTYIDVNEGFSKVSGYPREELIGHSPLPGDLDIWLSGEDREPFAKALRQTGEALGLEIKFRRKDGAIRDCILSARVLDVGGEPCHISIVSDITERKQAEQALRDSEERFRLFMEHSPTIAWVKDEQGRYLHLSKIYEKMIGLRLEDWYGKTDRDLWPPETAEVFQQNDQKVLATGAPIEIVEETAGQDGTSQYWLNTKFPFRDAAGNRYLAGIGLDITERKRAQEALRRSEEKFAKIFRTSPDAIAVARTSDGLYLEVNEGFTRITGYSREELLGHSPLPGDLAIWTHKEARDRFVNTLKETGEALCFEVTLRRKDGTFRQCILSGRILDIEGKHCHIAIITDITERKKAEDAMRQNEERHRIIIQTAMDGFCMVDMQGHLLEVNDTYCRMSGYGEQELLAMHIADLEVNETKNVVIKQIRQIKSQKEARFETRHRRKDGTHFDVEVSSKYRPTEGGRIEVFLRDITDRKKAEKAFEKSQDSLRALSAHLQTVREEERASIAREIHDDLGQLLTGLKMDLSWFLRHLHPDPGKLQEKVLGMGQLVDQTVQTVRRISTELRPRILDDFGLVAALEWQSEEFYKKAGIPCVFRSNVRHFDLEPDRSIAVFRIFQEALTNVARHSAATKVESSLKKNGKSLFLTIQDNGRGITEEEVANHQSLGLIGMRERALIFGGTVEIKGKNGKGTKVFLSLPVAK